ncbi:hypothetical protein CMI37_24620 [Candidatus Pacearchaeota archaeon]|nr:hypothetical protein [Candidatus Pacearchaeota archaeon]|tara:strand:+ start:2145 stop:2792 length:648 start_codon:yes stop_codon:yes gene_type:complete
MIMYASYTGTRRNKRALREHNWRMLMSPDTLNVSKGKMAPRWDDDTLAPYALDNGAWGCHQQGKPFDSDAFLWALDRIGAGADWVVAPDIVGGGLDSLSLTSTWLDRIDHALVLIAVQDGMEPEDVRPLLTSGRGLFLGGTTEWKLKTIAQWGNFARQVDCYFHVGRVNTARRIRMSQCAGAHSVDGTSVTKWACTIDLLSDTARQTCLFGRGTQ